MFEAWASVMGGILRAAGIPGFLDNLEDLYERADDEGNKWRAFVSVWWETFSDREVGVAEIYHLVREKDLGLDLGDGTERSQKSRLGMLLAGQRDRTYQVESAGGKVGLTITLVGEKQGIKRWSLRIKEPNGGEERETFDL